MASSRRDRPIMRDTIKSFASFSWALSLFGVEQMRSMFVSGGRDRNQRTAADAFDCVTHAAEDQLAPDLRSLFTGVDRWQHHLLDLWLGGPARTAPSRPGMPASPAPVPVAR